jgi:L-2-hydroxyglutarate oxidase LhgO
MTAGGVDVIVVGAGVVGLACARVLAEAGLDVVIAELEKAIGTGASSRNSEVLHAGLYYAPGSLKAQLCVRGRGLVESFCDARGVAYERCGKLIVATRDQDLERLETLHERGRANEVGGLQLLTRAQAVALEPELECRAALHSTASGIVDSHGLMTALLADAEAAGAVLAVRSRVVSAERAGHGWRIVVSSSTSDSSEEADSEVEAAWIVNAAGIDAQAVAAAIDGFPRPAIPQRRLAKGNYFSLGGRAPFSRLIYPTPVDGGLGVHLTLDLGGQARFGPDVQWLADDEAAAARELDYSVDESRGAAFAADLRRYWPRLPASALAPAYAGIRSKLSGPGEPAADFRIEGPNEHRCAGVVQLFGIESPGLTASMAIAERVRRIVCGR